MIELLPLTDTWTVAGPREQNEAGAAFAAPAFLAVASATRPDS